MRKCNRNSGFKLLFYSLSAGKVDVMKSAKRYKRLLILHLFEISPLLTKPYQNTYDAEWNGPIHGDFLLKRNTTLRFLENRVTGHHGGGGYIYMVRRSRGSATAALRISGARISARDRRSVFAIIAKRSA